jgi:hypothetical protein
MERRIRRVSLRSLLVGKMGHGFDYEQVCQMEREQMNRPDFYAIWQLLTAWGMKWVTDLQNTSIRDVLLVKRKYLDD